MIKLPIDFPLRVIPKLFPSGSKGCVLLLIALVLSSCCNSPQIDQALSRPMRHPGSAGRIAGGIVGAIAERKHSSLLGGVILSGAAAAEISGEYLPKGVRCPGNMVISPYRPKARPVPIKLLPPPPDNLMICPYSKGKFIVPTEVQPVPPDEGGENRGPMQSEAGIRTTSKPARNTPSAPKWTLFGQINEWLNKKDEPKQNGAPAKSEVGAFR